MRFPCTLLAARFGLTQHREQREMAAYALVIGKALMPVAIRCWLPWNNSD